ncbi:MAG: FixH family protein [Ignavibacteriota bacterium]|nr:FixH family protein [Ignavibacteriota bacterium]
MNWGYKIAVFFGTFVLITTGVTVYLMNQKVDIVTENYYEKELKYQEQIDKVTRTRALKESVEITNTGKELIIKFPNLPDKNQTKDFISLYRPSDDSKDVKIPILTDTSKTQLVSVDRLVKGYWKAKINWTSGGSEYYYESVFNL